jgi:phage/plasmid-like protein (TIGR03299 family)
MTATTLPKYAPESRALPWNVLGGDLTTEFPSVDAALTATGLDYEVFTVPSAAVMENGEVLISGDEFRQVVRPKPGGGLMVIGQSGTRLTPVQNRKAFAVADVLVQEFGATIKGACDYRNGKISVMVVGLGEIALKDRDAVNLNLLVRVPHDGSGAVSFSLTGTRPSCTNAVHAALRDAVSTWKMSNTPNAEARVNDAHQAIVKAVNYRDAFQVQAEAMIAQAVTDAEFAKIVAQFAPIDPEADPESAKVVRAEEKRETIQAIWNGQTIDGVGVKNTLWGAYSTLTEYLDWYRPVRGGDTARAEAQIDPTNPYARRSAGLWTRFAAMV